MIFDIKLAEEVFRIHSIYPDTYTYCQNYLLTKAEKVSAEITVTREDIERERQLTILDAAREGHQPPEFPAAILEETFVYRKIADYFSYHNGCVFHGVLLNKDGNGYLFTAASGTGKTTHVNNWLKLFPDAFVVNGDKPILRLRDNQIIGYGTPWSGKEGINRNTSVKLKAIIVLDRDTINHIEIIDPHAVLGKIASAIHRPADPQGMVRAMTMLMQINRTVPIYHLGCNQDPESAEVAYAGLPH